MDQASAEILRYKYDAGGRLTNRWSAAKGNTYYSYDAVGNLTNVDYPAGTTDLRYQYDARNRVTNMVDAVGTTEYTYTASSQLRIENGPWASDNVTNSYHASVPGLRTGVSVQQPTGTWAVTETPDAAKRLASVTSPAGTFTYTYKGPSLVWTNLALPNAAAITNSLDNVGRLTGTYLKTNASVVLNKYLYQYNKAGQRWLMTRSDGNAVTNFYDQAGQLVRAMGSGGQSTENLGYGYDPAWNLNKRTNVATVTTFTVNAKDQLTAVGATSYTYDSNGNLTGEGTTKVFTYDAENQLVSVYTTGGYMYRHDFVYDGRGRMRKRVDYTYTTNWVVSGETRYVYDGMRVIQERNSTNTPTVSYTRGQDLSGSLEGAGGIGGLLARSDQYSSGSMTRHACYFADGNGNVVNLVDAASAHTVWATYRYNPYGVATSSGTLASANVYRFSSKAYLDKPGLYYYGYRFYDPNLQRWLNRDPIGEHYDANLYRYVYNDSISYVDPDGLWGIWIGDFHLGWGDPDLVFDSDSWDDLAQGAAATADGLIPFADPFKDKYDPCDPIFAWSHASGEIAQNALLTAAGLRAASWLGGTRLGHGLNHNPYLRIGPGRMPRNGPFPPSTSAPRISIGPQRPGVPNPHIDLRAWFF